MFGPLAWTHAEAVDPVRRIPITSIEGTAVLSSGKLEEVSPRNMRFWYRSAMQRRKVPA